MQFPEVHRSRTAAMIGPVRQWWPVPAVVALAAALSRAFGPGYAGYDASWALVWGEQIAGGGLPDYESPVAPTPHPLANAVAIVLSMFDDGGEVALVTLTFLSFGALVAGVVVLVGRLAWWPAGIAAALLLATRGLLGREVAFASTDVPFLALVVWAGALEASRPRRGAPVLALLALAGLLRPDAWLLSLAYLTWIARTTGVRALPVPALLAIAAPLLWALSDLVVTGDPLHSLQGTRALAAELDRPTGLSTAADAVAPALGDVLGTLPLLAGAIGMLATAALAPRRVALPAAVACLGVLTYFVLGLAGLPVLLRYVVLPAAMLAVTAGIGLVLPRLVAGGRARTAAVAVSAIVGLLLIAAIPNSVGEVRDARAFTAARGAVQGDLRALTAQPAFRAAAARCPEIRIPDFRTRPVLLLDGSIDPARVVVGNLADGERGLLVTYATHAAARIFNLGAPGEAPLQALPARGRVVGRNDSWLAATVC